MHRRQHVWLSRTSVRSGAAMGTVRAPIVLRFVIHGDNGPYVAARLRGQVAHDYIEVVW